MLRKVLTCRECGWRTVSGRDDLVARLRLVGQLRREKEPDDAIVEALIVDSARHMTCPMCKHVGLIAKEADAEEDDDAGDWQEAVLCEICRKAIDPERLEFLPETRRCAECQHLAETDALPDDDVEYCPRCGSLVELRVSHAGGLTRYKRLCTGDPPCRL